MTRRRREEKNPEKEEIEIDKKWETFLFHFKRLFICRRGKRELSEKGHPTVTRFETGLKRNSHKVVREMG